MSLSVTEAHQRLTDAGIPTLTESHSSAEDLRSAELQHLATGATDSLPEPNPDDEAIVQNGASLLPRSLDKDSSPAETKSSHQEVVSSSGKQAQHTRGEIASDAGSADLGGDKGPSQPGSSSSGHRSRPKHKEEWDRRLLSYVRRKTHNQSDDETGTNTEHNLAVEAAARDAVCDYEKARGRIPQNMPQSHPGFDIVSFDPATGTERRIEVKGRSGEWNKLGVGLTRLEFSNAQDFGDEYWLYVVEFAFDKKTRRIHPIQSPAFKVDSFMFDGNWRDVVVEEQADPCYAFQTGARITHDMYGIGVIQKVELRGAMQMLRIQFERGGERILPINLAVMSVLEDSGGDDNP